jgi:uncharacterized protein (TIGR02284 family)
VAEERLIRVPETKMRLACQLLLPRVSFLSAKGRWQQFQADSFGGATDMKDHETSTLNSLLRGELAATETYQQALGKLGMGPGAAELRHIHQEHREAANTLRQHIHAHGGKPDQGSGTWGAFAKAIQGAATLLGNSAALRALKEGEERGIKDYESAIKDETLPSDCRTLITTKLLPQTKQHIPVLDRLMKA